MHRRAVVLTGNEGAVLVVDHLRATRSHQYSQRWPFHPSLEVSDKGARHILMRSARAGALLLFSALGDFDLRVARGEERPWRGWWSDGLESIVPAWLASVDLEAEGTVELAALVIPFVGEVPNVDDFELRLEHGSGSSLVMRTSVWDTIELDLASSRPSVRRGATTLAS
jgi:hypothetical protein